jgi:hypothetical protein
MDKQSALTLFSKIEPELIADGYVGWFAVISNIATSAIALYATDDEAFNAADDMTPKGWVAQIGEHLFIR